MEKVGNLINCLTSDEDFRQELWVHYLNGNAEHTFASHLQKLNAEYTEDESLRHNIWLLIKNPPSEKLTNILADFSDFEKSIICLIMLGQNIDQISAHKGINEVRIRQAIATIRYNPLWEKYYYGTEEEVH